MFDILVYLFENYYQSDLYPDQDALARKLTAAGFEHDDISDALTWLQGLSVPGASTLPDSLAQSTAFRGYAESESEEEARSTHPTGIGSNWDRGDDWIKSKDHVKLIVTKLGVAITGTPGQVIVASFHAG